MKGKTFESNEEKETFIKTLRELKDKAVIVEGKKDVNALKALGLNYIIPINGMPLTQFAMTVANSLPGPGCSNISNKPGCPDNEVIILTDYDREGKKLECRLEILLRRHKVRVNKRLRRVLSGFGKSRIEEFKNVKI